MARFKGNAHDVYEKNADFIHENSTLTKTVDKPSEHFHKSNISWTSDTNIKLDSPEVEETYNTIIHRKKFSVYAYGLFKGLIGNYSQSLYAYSKNKSIWYLNFSGVTTNTGAFFILPGPCLIYSGALQIKVSAFTMDTDAAAGKINEPNPGKTFVVDPQGKTSVLSKSRKFVVDAKGATTIQQTAISQRFIDAKKAKYYGGIYVRQTTIQNLS